MAKQRGIIKLEGTIGDITFLKSRDGYVAKEKSGVSAARIATDPAFQRTRENGAEFGRAGKAGKLLRTSMRGHLQKVADSRMVGRLTKEMVRVLQADQTSVRGKRNVIDGESELLFGFDFNNNSKLSTTLFAPYTATIDRASGECKVNLPAFIPGQMVSAPAGATHFRLFAAASAIDFENENYKEGASQTAVLAWNQTPTAVLNLTQNVGTASTHPLFLALGIEFLQMVNGSHYPLKNGAYNAFALVQVDGA